MGRDSSFRDLQNPALASNYNASQMAQTMINFSGVGN